MRIGWKFLICFIILPCSCYAKNSIKLNTTTEFSFSSYYVLKDDIIETVLNEDEIEKDSKIKYFPKCCPPDFIYDHLRKTCTNSVAIKSIYKELSLEVNIIKSFLSDCAVVVDHIVPKESFTNLVEIAESNGSLIYNGNKFRLSEYCVDNDVDSYNRVIRECHSEEYCLKDGVRCIKKCCPDGHVFMDRTDGMQGRKICRKQPEYGFQIEEYQSVIKNLTLDRIAIYYPKRNCTMYRADTSTDQFTVEEDGSFYFKSPEGWRNFTAFQEEYCFETYGDTLGERNISLLLLCIQHENVIKFKLSKVAMPLSCVCLLAMMAIYLFVYKLRKVIHRVVFCYCTAQFIGFLSLTILQLNPDPGNACKPLAFTVLFGFLAAFTWLNIMCYDIWKALSSMEDVSVTGTLLKTILYSAYGWLLPAFITIMCLLEHYYYWLPDTVHAFVGDKYCLLERRLNEGNFGQILFMIFPTTILFAINIVLFVLTIRYISDAKDNIAQMSELKADEKKKKRKLLNVNKKKLFMAVKLFLVMGVNWTFEIISSIIDFKATKVLETVEIVLDTFNCLQGVFVFFIFILKWRIIKRTFGKIRNLSKKWSGKTVSITTPSTSTTQKSPETSVAS